MAILNYLTTIRFEERAVEGLADDLAAAGISRPLLVTDRGVVSAGLLEGVLARLPSGLPVFAETPPNPTEDAVAMALEVYGAAACDGVVALGGGSPMDLAKAVAVLATHEGPLASFAASNGGIGRITVSVQPPHLDVEKAFRLSLQSSDAAAVHRAGC